MPLVRETEAFDFVRFEGIFFWMLDDKKPVLCKVAHEALRDRSARDGTGADEVATFARHRERVERIASMSYDIGMGNADSVVVVPTGKLTPPTRNPEKMPGP
jgi:uncharacterized protein DUF1488